MRARWTGRRRRVDLDEVGGEPDYRFSLANERTFLAYVRTAFALDAGGLALVQFLDAVGSDPLRKTAGLVLIALGLVVALAGYWRWRGNQIAMRRGEPLPQSPLAAVLAGVVALVSVLAMVLVLLG